MNPDAMNEQPIHHLYLHFQELPLSRRVLYTGVLLVLGMGYLFGLLYLYASDSGRDGVAGLSVQDIVISYSGTTEGTRLEAALRGPMGNMVGPTDLGSILGWVQGGAERNSYESQIRPIVEQNCLTCHVFTLVRVSHIHLFGLTFIFFLMGLIFSHAFLRPVWLKSAIMGLPFVCIVSDVSSWYFTKLFSGFAWVVLFAGALMGLSFATMWVVSMWQIWFYKVPDWVAQREQSGQQRIG
jgi:hypothetical protein